MDSTYNIVISIRTPKGMQEIGIFFLRTDDEFAHNIFDSLKGNPASGDDALIRIDLEKKADGILPVRLKSISCTLNQYADNSRVITRDIFKYFTLEK